MRSRTRAFFRIAFVVAMAALPPFAFSQPARDTVAVNTKAGYARLLFAFEEPAPVKASIADGVLTIELTRAIDASADSIVTELGPYVSVGKRSDDGLTYRFALQHPLGLHISTAGNRTAVDLVPAAFKGEPPDLPRPPPPPRKQPVDVAKLPVVPVRISEFENYARLIFDWGKPVAYTVTPGPGRTRIRFDAPARIDFAMLKSQPTPWVKGAESRVDDGATIVEIETDAESTVRDSKDGSKIAIDVMAPTSDASAINVAQNAPAANGATLRGSVAPASAQASAAAKAAPAPARSAPSAELARDGAILKFPGARDGAVAVFSRGDTLWVVLDDHPALEAASLLSPLAGLLVKADASEVSGAAVLRLGFRTPHLASVSQTENDLTVRMSTGTSTPPTTIALSRQGSDGQMALSASAPGATRVLTLDDSDAGDRILVVPTRAGRGMLTPKRFVELLVLPSAAGLAFIPYADDLQANVRQETVRFSRPQGLALSAGSDAASEPVIQVSESKEGPTFIDFAQWMQPGSDVIETTKTLRGAVARLPESEGGKARLQLARYLLANELAPEALGEINLIQSDDIRAQSDTALQVMKGVAQYMMGRYRDARATLSAASLGSDPHAALWRGMAANELSDYDDARRDLLTSQSVLHLYPPLWQTRARLARAETGIAQGDLASAHDALDQLAPVLGPRETAEAELMQAQLLGAQGHANEAVAKLRALENVTFPPVAVKASFARIEAELNAKTLKPQDAIEPLEKLRYRWRGDDVELRILRKLGSLYFAESRWREGLDVLRIAAANFPGAELAREAQDDMRTAFNELFLGSKTEAMPPVQALALFYDFIELTPIGRDGDEMIRRLTERLVTIDLLAPAEELLDHQVYKRLDGVARSVVATQLALIYLLDNKPKEALKTINDTRLTRLPDDVNHRRRLLEARALAGLKQYDAAVALLADDASPDAARLRNDIHWQSGNWPVAGAKNEEALGDRATAGGPLTREERAQVMRAAVAYSLAGDDVALSRLRTRFAAKMEDSPDAKAFTVVTGKLEQQGVAFQDLAKSIASVDTLQAFMADLKKQGAVTAPTATSN